MDDSGATIPNATVDGAPPAPRRVGWVDCAKGIGIVLVVFGHNWNGFLGAGLIAPGRLFQNVYDGIYSFHMPLFFLLAGLFAWRAVSKDSGSFLLDRLRTLVYPYVVWSVLQGVISNRLAGSTNSGTRFSPVRNLLYEPYGQFWFLYVLLLCYLLLLVLHRLRVGKAGVLIVAAAWYASAPWVSMGQWGVGYQLRNYFLFFALGVALHGAMLAHLGTIGPRAALLVSGALFGVLTWIAWRGLAGRYFENPGLPLIGVVASIALAVACDAWRVPLIERLGQLSLPIFLAHVLAAGGARIVLQKVLHVNSLPVHLVVGMVAGVGGPVLLYYAAKGVGFPWLFTLKDESARAKGGLK